MIEIALHILDIIQNSIAAGALLIELIIDEQPGADYLEVVIRDNGCGMDNETLNKVTDPFYTSRSTRRVGLGLPMFKTASAQTGGSLDIQSRLGIGTEVRARFGYHHIDRQPLGDMAETMLTLIVANPYLDFYYKHIVEDREFELDTRMMREQLGELPLNDQAVITWLKDYLAEGVGNVQGAVPE